MTGSELTELRLKAGYTQRGLAEVSGVSQTMLSHLENKRVEMTMGVASKLAPHLGVSARSLLPPIELPEDPSIAERRAVLIEVALLLGITDEDVLWFVRHYYLERGKDR